MNALTLRLAALTAGMVALNVAHADSTLTIAGDLAPSDLVAIGYDGPNSPAASTFYYDMHLIWVDTPGIYSVSMTSQSAQLAPWVGVYAMNFSALDYFNPQPIDLVAGAALTTVSMDLLLQPGTYQTVASSVDWIEEPDALDEGPYSISIVGPAGSNIRLVPAPGSAATAIVGAALLSRRRRTSR